MTDTRLSVVITLIATVMALAVPGRAQQPQARLRIVVIEGEDSVNIVQQRTAVAPVVEVRDENDQPVAGALVTFAIRGGRNARLAGNLRTVTLTTDATGRATVAGVTPTGNGPVQIDISAQYRGVNASTTVSQTNVATAAQAASASGAGAAGGAAGAGGAVAGTAAAAGAAAGGGAGLSGVAIGSIVAAGAATAGVTAAVKSSDKAAEAAPTPVVTNLAGPFATSYTWAFSASPTNTGGPCSVTRALNGTSTIQFTTTGSAVSGTLEITYNETNASQTCAAGYFIGEGPITWRTPVSGTTSQMAANAVGGGFTIPVTGGSVNGVGTFAFTGSFAGGVLNGTVILTRNGQGTGAVGPITVTASTTTAVTLR